MHRFWTQFSGPIVEAVRPRRILQIGTETGLNTRNILDYCHRTGAHADIIEPAVAPIELRNLLAAYAGAHDFYPSKNPGAISKLDPPDILFLAGCHNWRTTLNDVMQVFTRARDANAPEPILLAHNCAWPYARRDMYTQSEASSPERRHSYAYKGMLPGRADLTDRGLNGDFANALQEGGTENGVLKAIEDFIASWPTPISLTVLPFFNGMGIAVPEKRRTPDLDALLRNFFSGETMLETVKALEEQSMFIIAEGQHRDATLIRRTDALRRARDLLAAQSAQITALEDEIARLNKPGS